MALPTQFETNLIHFKDGDHVVPEWQLPYVVNLNTSDTTYEEFVGRLNSLMLRRATSDAFAQHMRGAASQFGR